MTAGVMSYKELSEMCDLPSNLDVDVISIFQFPSNHMTFQHLVTLKEKIEEILSDKEINGIVVTPGTDTLEETAYFLDLVISDKRPIVVTGSQRRPTVTGTDAIIYNEDFSKQVNIGDKIQIIPNHICSVVNLHEKAYLVSNGEVVDKLNIEGRGRLQ
ncbi:asparaginase domain-containing protein [Priestia endophytica]|uniref:asparaginase domain-containing protein n=1 Tax=Priestia endophytica TaxID=135735 RepID=UPI00203F3A1D|nr:asparaginase domain-containing protein [Priestia endophytica]MCM3537954.1 asparaginase domain-containing protein [Priestia endophytica]